MLGVSHSSVHRRRALKRTYHQICSRQWDTYTQLVFDVILWQSLQKLRCNSKENWRSRSHRCHIDYFVIIYELWSRMQIKVIID